jgi:hypothetical protein
MAKPKFLLTEQTTLALKRLLAVPEGEHVTWGQLSQTIGMDARLEGRHHVQHARHIARREARVVFGAVHGVGLRRLTPPETVDRGKLRRRKIANQTRYGLQELDTLNARLSELPREKVVELLAHQALLQSLRVESSYVAAQRQERQVAEKIVIDWKDFKGS